MDHIGIDVHKQESQICILPSDGDGKMIEQRIVTTRERLTATLGASHNRVTGMGPSCTGYRAATWISS
jgi:hypothetical protein